MVGGWVGIMIVETIEMAGLVVIIETIETMRQGKEEMFHLEYMAARKSWIAGRTAEGGQSVIKSVANFTTLTFQ